MNYDHCDLATSTTLAPSLASLSATARPIPWLAPVTRARLYLGADMTLTESVNCALFSSLSVYKDETCFSFLNTIDFTICIQ